MKTFYSILIAMLALFVFAPLADAKPPFWDDQINSPVRFKVLSEFANAAVFEKETGLVWEQSPAITGGPDNDGRRTWFNALVHCYQRVVGGRKGWRLPTIEELASLVDPNNPGGNPDLPPGHPFANVQSSFWSATTFASDTISAWLVIFDTGEVDTRPKSALVPFVWCVRGGQGVDGVQ